MISFAAHKIQGPKEVNGRNGYGNVENTRLGHVHLEKACNQSTVTQRGVSTDNKQPGSLFTCPLVSCL